LKRAENPESDSAELLMEMKELIKIKESKTCGS
jgi:hypothetical protein